MSGVRAVPAVDRGTLAAGAALLAVAGMAWLSVIRDAQGMSMHGPGAAPSLRDGLIRGFVVLRLDLLLHAFQGCQDAAEQARCFEILTEIRQLRQYRRLIGRQFDGDRTDLGAKNDA